jgi:flagellar biosynthesis GTPase FlhF
VKSADPGAESVTLEKGGVDVTVKLGETSGGGNGKGGTKGRRAVRPMMLRSMGGLPVHSPKTADLSSEPSGDVRLGGLARLRQRRAEMRAKAQEEAARKAEADAVAAAEREERAEREAEEKRQRAEREAREAEERAQQREALRQIQEQLRKEREAREAAEQQAEGAQEEQSESNNVE